MKFEYSIIKKHKLIVEVVSGKTTIEGLAEKTKALFSDPNYDPSYIGIADYRKASSQITRAELYGFANFINQSEQFGEAKWAILANDPMVVALSQIFQQRLIETDIIGIFSSPEAAADFLENPIVLDYIK